ncbi:MAG: tRNA epoxyqueuosine(34) reductase QueG [bacterium]
MLKKKIKEYAVLAGFDLAGITLPDNTDQENNFKTWLDSGCHADMKYLGENLDIRLGRKQSHAEIISTIICIKSYYAEPKNRHLARYVTETDYHIQVRQMLENLCSMIKREHGDFYYKIFVDTSPVLEKYLAYKAGLGFIGKNTLLVNPQTGSFFWIGGMHTSLKLEPDEPLKHEGCGSCSKCVNTCPLNALEKPYVLDARKCLSYWTTSYRGEELPKSVKSALNGCIFGCDICQDVCPYNNNAVSSGFKPLFPLETLDDILLKAEMGFKRFFRSSSVYSMGKKRIIRNIAGALNGRRNVL